MTDVVSITAIIISSITAIGTIAKELHLKTCDCFCINSDCRDENKNLEKQIEMLNDKIIKNESKLHKHKMKLNNMNDKKRNNSLSTINEATPPSSPTSQISNKLDISL